MTDISAKFGLGGGSGAFQATPYNLEVGIHDATGINTYQDVTVRASTTANFWTRVAEMGYAVDTSYTADTYKDLVDITSGNGGILGNVFGPTAGGAETTTFRITLPSGVYEIPVLMASGQRAWLGLHFRTTIYTGAAPQYGYASLNAAKTIYDTDEVSNFVSVMRNQQLGRSGGLMSFTGTMKIEAKHSANVTGTSSQERHSGIIIQRSI